MEMLLAEATTWPDVARDVIVGIVVLGMFWILFR